MVCVCVCVCVCLCVCVYQDTLGAGEGVRIPLYHNNTSFSSLKLSNKKVDKLCRNMQVNAKEKIRFKNSYT
jgi:hypothetical protein